MSLDGHLLRKQHISNFLSSSTDIWSSPHHELISNHSKCEVVNAETVVLPAHYFGRHIPRCARSIRAVIRLEYSRNTHVGNAQIPILLHDDILWFDVSVDHVFIVHVFKANNHACNHEFGLGLVEPSLFANVEAEIATVEQI